MIAYDQVVSGGSAECTTKMAAAPAADSVYSLPGFPTFSSLLLLVSFFSFFYLPLLLLPLITPYLVPFFCTLPIPLRVFRLDLSLITSCALFRRKTRCRRARSGARWMVLPRINWYPHTLRRSLSIIVTDARRRRRPAAPNRMRRATARPSNPHQINHRLEKSVFSRDDDNAFPHPHFTAPRNLERLHSQHRRQPTGEAAASFAHALLRETGTRARWHHRPSTRGSGHSAPLTLPLAHVVRRSCSCPSYGVYLLAATRSDRETSECSLGSTFALRRRELVWRHHTVPSLLVVPHTPLSLHCSSRSFSLSPLLPRRS